MKYPIRYMARLTLEASTPLSIGAGRNGLENERLIARDANGLPYLPGSSLAGVIRAELSHWLEDASKLDTLFGYQKQDKGQGSRVIVSPGILLAADGKTVLEGLHQIDFNDPYFQAFQRLPQRDHVRISHKGVAAEHAKFEEELVYKGARFVCEIELKGDSGDQALFKSLLATINSPDFRLGAGTRNGFGNIQVVQSLVHTYDLSQWEGLQSYLGRSSSLNAPVSLEPAEQNEKKETLPSRWNTYRVELTPENFFLFGAGTIESTTKERNGEKKVAWLDALPKKEKFISWETLPARLVEHPWGLIPGTSLKGALAHRVAFHYNREAKNYLETLSVPKAEDIIPAFDQEAALQELEEKILAISIEEMNFKPKSTEWQDLENQIQALEISDSSLWQDFQSQVEELQAQEKTYLPVGENNEAVRTLFGFAKNSELTTGETGQRGRVIISDVYLKPEKIQEKVFPHVAIDRFTGGYKDGALFEEKVLTYSETIQFDIRVEKQALQDEPIKTAWEQALKDLTEGRLPLGGHTPKGHGIFSGSFVETI